MKWALFIQMLLGFSFCIGSFSALCQQADYEAINKRLVSYFTIGNLAAMESLADSALPLIRLEKGKTDSVKMVTLYYASMLYNFKRRFDKAERSILQMLNNAKFVFDEYSLIYCDMLDQRYELLTRTFRYSEAIEVLQQELRIFSALSQTGQTHYGFQGKKGKDGLYDLISGCLRNIGYHYGLLGDFRKTYEYITQSKKYFNKQYVLENDPHDFVQINANEASFLMKLDDPAAAEAIYIETGDWLKKTGYSDNPVYADLLIRHAGFYNYIGDFAKAKKLYDEAKQILDNNLETQTHGYAALLLSLGEYHKRRKEWHKAEQLFKQTLKINTDPTTNFEIAYYLSAQLNLADLYLKQEAYVKLDELYNFVDSFFNSKTDTAYYMRAHVLLSKAAYFSTQKKYAAADSIYLLVSKAVKKRSGRHSSAYANVLLTRAKNLLAIWKPAEAEKLILEALAISKNALTNNFAFFSEEQKQTYINEFMGFYNFLYKLTHRRRTHTLVHTAFETQSFLKGLLLNTSTFNSAHKVKDALHRRMIDEYRFVKKQLATVYFEGKDSENVTALEKRAGELEKGIAKISGISLRQSFTPLSVEKCRQSLKNREALVDFFQYKDGDSVFYGCFVLNKNLTTPVFQILFEQATLKEYLRAANSSATNYVNHLYSLGPQTLYAMVWKKIDKNISAGNTVYVSPTGLLHQISFNAMPNRSAKLLMDRFKIMTVSSSKNLSPTQNPLYKSNFRIAVFGGIDYNTDTSLLESLAKNYATASRSTRFSDDRFGITSWRFLPGTVHEVRYIANYLPAKQVSLFTGKVATEESFKNLSDKSPEIIHVATHGFFFPNSAEDTLWKRQQNDTAAYKRFFKKADNPLLRSGLIMSGANNSWRNNIYIKGVDDGILTASEISLLNLSNTRLAVLSACETGLGDIQGSEGVYGLQRAFKMAGVQNLVMSLWKVPDAETAEFMQEFYKNLFAKQTISDAFYKAQTTMKNKYRDDPYKWAAWVLVR